MSTEHAAHIQENRIVQLIADGGGMLPDETMHLQECGSCRTKMGNLQEDLDRLRYQATQATPLQRHHFTLPTGSSTIRQRRSWGLNWAVGTALSAVLLALFLWMGKDTRLPGLPPKATQTTVWEDPEMVEVNMLAENALPEAYLILSESLDGGYDEGFLDFLIPSLEDESLS